MVASAFDERVSWQGVGDAFEAQVFNVYEQDLRGALPAALGRLRKSGGRAADFGCGTGRFLPPLCRKFTEVTGIELASDLLSQAEQRCSRFKNLTLVQKDLSRRFRLARRVDAAVCVNALLSVDRHRRLAMLRNIRSNLRRGGALLLVVPALESALLVERVLAEWHRRARAAGAFDPESCALDETSKAQLLFGEVLVGGVPTQHYLREEFPLLLEQADFVCERTEKLEYAWDSTFDAPPPWLKEPGPWDWLVEARAT